MSNHVNIHMVSSSKLAGCVSLSAVTEAGGDVHLHSKKQKVYS